MSWLSFFFPRSDATVALSQPVLPPPTLCASSAVSVPTRDDDTELHALYETVDADAGLPVVEPAAILRFFATEIEDTRHMLGVGTEIFDGYCLPVLLALARHLQTLPATRAAQFRRPLGAMKRSILVGRACARAATAVIFDPDASQSDRKLLQTHWRVGCWIAGVCGDLGYLVDQVEVVDSAGEAWRPVFDSQTEWAQRRKTRRVWVRWRTRHPQTHHKVSSGSDAYLAARIVPPNVLAYLQAGSGEIVRTVLDCISGTTGTHGRTLFQLVESARAAVANADLQSDPTHYGRPVIGIVMPEFVVSAMRSCVSEHIWTVNERMSTVFHTQHGLFVKWPYAAKELRARLLQMKVSPAPAEPEQLLEALTDAGLLVPPPGSGLASALWTIEPESVGKPITAIKLKGPHVLCGDEEPWGTVPCKVTLAREKNSQDKVASDQPDSKMQKSEGGSSDGEATDKPRRKNTEPIDTYHASTVSDVVKTESPTSTQPKIDNEVRDWRAVIDNEVTVRDRVILNRFLLHAKVKSRTIFSSDFTNASIPFAVVERVLEGIEAVDSRTDEGLVLVTSFAKFVEEGARA